MEKSLRNFLTFSHCSQINHPVSHLVSWLFCWDLLDPTVPEADREPPHPGVWGRVIRCAPASLPWCPSLQSACIMGSGCATPLSVRHASSACLPPWLCGVSMEGPFPPAFSLYTLCGTQLTSLLLPVWLLLRRQNRPFPLPLWTGRNLHLHLEDLAVWSSSYVFGGLWVLISAYLVCHLGLWCDNWFSEYHFPHLGNRSEIDRYICICIYIYVYISIYLTSIYISIYRCIMGFGRIKMVSESYIALCLGHDRCQENTVCSMIFIKCHCCLLACGLFVHHLSLALGSLGAEPELGFFVSSKGSARFLQQLYTRFPVHGFHTQLTGSSQPFLPSHLTWAGLGGLCIFIYDGTWSLPLLSFSGNNFWPLFLKRRAGLWSPCCQWAWWLPGHPQRDEGPGLRIRYMGCG